MLELHNNIWNPLTKCKRNRLTRTDRFVGRSRLSSSRQSRPPSFYQLNPVDETHFGRPWCQRHGSGRVRLVSGHTSSFRGPSRQALTLLGGVKFIAWLQRRPFLGECRQGLRHFWNRWATLVRMVGRLTNTAKTRLSSRLREQSPRGQTLSRGARFIGWCMRRPFL